MIPYIEQPVWNVGPLTIHAFGVAVAAAIWYGLTMADRRFEQSSLDAVVGKQLGGWMIVGGILGAHLLAVLVYFPDKLRDDPWLLLRVWEDISSFGGMLGGLAGAFLFFAIRQPESTRRTRVSYLDAVAFVFPGALAIGRVGCALAHDHPGVVTSFPLAVSLETAAARSDMRGVYASADLSSPTGDGIVGFHDLGLYELLFLALVIVPLFAYWNRQKRPPGFYLIAFALMYLPVRFGLDMLRVSDARYLNLTPAQWGAALVLAILPLVAMDRRKIQYALSGTVILATAWACWSGSP
jgi:phosphatidylglycerol:prolipoprotein diacylglycerol transferase